VQVIPLKRSPGSDECEIRAETDREAGERNFALRSTLASEGWYRKFSRADR
jgi:hypothetical protein